MPIQDLFAPEAKQEKLQEEKAIVSAIIRYFEAAPCKQKSTKDDVESAIINNLHRYFVTK